MGERRNRKSFWDTEDDSKHMSDMREHNSWAGKDHHSTHGSGRYHNLTDSRTSSMRDSRDHSGWPSWESVEDDPIAPMSHSFKNTYEGNEMGGEKKYHKTISSGFEEVKLQNYNHTHEYDRSHSQRYMQKGRSRSRNRSRTRGRSWSRSLSRGRERGRGWSRSLSRGRERGRGRGWCRSRSRSRSDGYGYGNANAHRRRRSPIGDYRRQNYGWNDKRSGQEKSPQTCRDYASGQCRKGSQCRFFHPDSIRHRDGELVEDDRVESWRGRSEHSQISKHSYTRLGFESRNGVSDLYHGEEEQFLNRNRASIPCRDFKIGHCRWGDACRFSHGAASAESFGQDSRNTTFDEDFDHGKPLCRFFAAGRCNRDNCRFSHDDPNSNNLEGRLDKGIESQSSHDKSYCRNAPKWDDATRISDTPMPTGWGEAGAADTTSTVDITDGQSDDRWGFKSKHDNKIWGVQEYPSNSLSNERQPFPPRESGSYGEDMGPAKSFAEDNVPHKQDHLILPGLKLQNKDGIANLHGSGVLKENESPTVEALQQNAPPDPHPQQHHFGVTINPMSAFGSTVLEGLQSQNKDGIPNLHGLSPLQENRSLTIAALQHNVPPAPRIQHQHCGVTSNPMSSFGSTVLVEVKDTRYTDHPILLSGQSFNQNDIRSFAGHSYISTESGGGQNMHYTNPSNGLDTDLKQPETHTTNPLNVQIHGQNDKKIVQSPGSLEVKAPKIFINLLASKHPNQVSNSLVTNGGQQVSPVEVPVSLTQNFVNEFSQTSAAGIDASNSRGMLPSFSDSTGYPPLASTSNVQDNVPAASLDQFHFMGNSRENTEPGNLKLAQATDNQNDQMKLSKSSLPSIVGAGVESSKLKHPESPIQEREMVANLGITGDSKATGEESKDMQENRPSENLDGQRKLEEGGANKDEKGMRMFKNSLVELVKEILKPTWKEGRMSRDVHKTVVRKVVDKVSSTIQADHIPKTQDKVNLYLSSSKPKITKLVQAYVQRSRKPDA